MCRESGNCIFIHSMARQHSADKAGSRRAPSEAEFAAVTLRLKESGLRTTPDTLCTAQNSFSRTCSISYDGSNGVQQSHQMEPSKAVPATTGIAGAAVHLTQSGRGEDKWTADGWSLWTFGVVT